MASTLVLIGIGGFFGAISRYYIINVLKRVLKKDFIPTIIVNLSASYILGMLANHLHESSLYILICIGFLGAYSTFSTLIVEAWKLFYSGRKVEFISYLFLSLIGGITFCYLGLWCGKLIFS